MDFIAIHAASKPDAACASSRASAPDLGRVPDRRNRLAHSLAGLVLGGREGRGAPTTLSRRLLAPAGARALGAVPVPMNHRLVAEEVAYILDHSDGVIAFADDSFIPVVEQLRPGALKVRHWILMGEARRPWALHLDDLMGRGSPDTPAAAASAAFGGSMIYTGGTTGKPKGALRGAVNPAIMLGFMQALDLADPSHVHLVAGPMYHSAPGGVALCTHRRGSAVVVMPRFDPEQALWTIERHRCTSTFMAPTLIKRIVDLPEQVRRRYDVSSMRVLVVAAAPCPMRVKEEAMRYFGPVLYEFYGSTELSINTILRPEDVLRKPGSCGRAAPCIDLAILDADGRPVAPGTPRELYVRRYAGMFVGSYKADAATRESWRGDWVSVGTSRTWTARGSSTSATASAT